MATGRAGRLKKRRTLPLPQRHGGLAAARLDRQDQFPVGPGHGQVYRGRRTRLIGAWQEGAGGVFAPCGDRAHESLSGTADIRIIMFAPIQPV